MHTQPVEEHGTDLNAVIELFCSEDYINVHFTGGMLDQTRMNWLYNLADTCILLTSNEGWGLSLTEALLLAGKCIIANVTGGMQDQMRFVKDGNGLTLMQTFQVTTEVLIRSMEMGIPSISNFKINSRFSTNSLHLG
jgi:glycosyltransferase involved in cell wall biosynthesis